MNLSRPITGRAVLYAMLGFFAVIFAVNGSFVYFALSSFPGVSSDDSYKEGLAYNKTLAAAKKQNALGWKSQADLSSKDAVRIVMLGQSGKAISGLDVSAVLKRPAQDGLDQGLVFTESSPGHYQSPVKGLLAGRWWLEISVSQGGSRIYFKVHDLMAP